MSIINNLFLILGNITPENTAETISPGVAAVNDSKGTIPIPEGPDLFTVVQNLLNTTFGVVGVIVVIMIIIGGFYYMASQGEPDRVQKGKNTILYGIIGLIICLSAFAIVNFVLAGLNGA